MCSSDLFPSHDIPGISISDFRNVNSLQRFLEIRIRQSPRYKNLVKGLFDVDLDYDELMMPEFLGGISDSIPVYKVTQTTPTEGNPLGSFAGQGSLQSGMRHVIRKYCPEDGYILGVMSVVPAANYSQLLPPHFSRMVYHRLLVLGNRRLVFACFPLTFLLSIAFVFVSCIHNSPRMLLLHNVVFRQDK